MLYGKYRPIDFDTVVGQDTIIKTIRNQIINGNIAHAYLFSGTRGTGKTTVAKIFARAINCTNELNGNPCNECETCKSAIDGANLNIVEMDAASNRSIDDIRRVIEQTEYPPINGEKYKVFIIDEAHALTQDASRALLKSLEEPPEYVVYILATTDPNKLSETVLSRCQKYNFKRINIETIVDYLKKICENEKIDIEEDALVFIAEKSDGSMRESISKLDSVRAYSINEKLSKDKVIDILGVVGDDEFEKVITSINIGDIETAFKILSESLEKGKDINFFVNDLIWHLRNLLLVKDLTGPTDALNITKLNFDKLKNETKLISKDVLIYFIEELSRTARVMKYDENRRVILETTFIRLANPETNFLESSVMVRLKIVEDMIKERNFIRIDEKEKEDIKIDTKQKEIKLSKATMEEIKKITNNWKLIASSVDQRVKTVIQRSKPIPGNEKEPGFIEVQVKDEDFKFLNLFDINEKIEESLAKSANEVINKNIIFKLVSLKDSKYTENITWSIDNALTKIEIKVEEEND